MVRKVSGSGRGGHRFSPVVLVRALLHRVIGGLGHRVQLIVGPPKTVLAAGGGVCRFGKNLQKVKKTNSQIM